MEKGRKSEQKQQNQMMNECERMRGQVKGVASFVATTGFLAVGQVIEEFYKVVNRINVECDENL